jgi:hypothetical protein
MGDRKKEYNLWGNIPLGGLQKGERCCIIGAMITDKKGELHESYTGASEKKQKK